MLVTNEIKLKTNRIIITIVDKRNSTEGDKIYGLGRGFNLAWIHCNYVYLLCWGTVKIMQIREE